MTSELLLYGLLLLVFVADLLWGDPRWPAHPVRFIGRLCEFYEAFTRQRLGRMSLMIKGAVAFFLVICTTIGTLALLFFLLDQINGTATLIGALIISYFSIAAGDLVTHSREVYHLLKAGDIVGARGAVGLMVGRDTGELDGHQIARACVESVSENMVDGITAPLFWAFICSLAGFVLSTDPLVCGAFGFLSYKAVNTMDSMYGYKNERYIEFGRLAARFDDVCNFLPARLSGFCLVIAASLLGFDGRGAARVLIADRFSSSSPNSGHSEAAVAGALGIQLGGESSYFGQATSKPIIGEGLAPVEPGAILRSNRLIIAGSLLFFLICCLLHMLLLTILR